MEAWEKWWGSEAEYDISQDSEEIYESIFKKSAVYWLPFWTKNQTPSDDLNTRPEEYDACGYTSDFEAWGVYWTEKAIDAGMNDPNSILEFLKTATSI